MKSFTVIALLAVVGSAVSASTSLESYGALSGYSYGGGNYGEGNQEKNAGGKIGEDGKKEKTGGDRLNLETNAGSKGLNQDNKGQENYGGDRNGGAPYPYVDDNAYGQYLLQRFGLFGFGFDQRTIETSGLRKPITPEALQVFVRKDVKYI